MLRASSTIFSNSEFALISMRRIGAVTVISPATPVYRPTSVRRQRAGDALPVAGDAAGGGASGGNSGWSGSGSHRPICLAISPLLAWVMVPRAAQGTSFSQ